MSAGVVESERVVVGLDFTGPTRRQLDVLGVAVRELSAEGATPVELASLFGQLAVHFGKKGGMRERALRGLVRVLWALQHSVALPDAALPEGRA